MPRVLTMVLAGGEGKRLYPLTADRAKPAVPFGGKYRIIDFVLSNLINSGLLQIKVLTQYKSDSLIQHLSRTWSLSTILGQYVDVVPAQMRTGREWFRGSADAIYQNLNLIKQESPDLVAIFGADHIYRMDVWRMVEHHVDTGADLTIAAIPVEASQCSRFGVMETDASGRVTAYSEKPERAAPGPDGTVLASMGNFIFKTSVLVDAVVADARVSSGHDIPQDIVTPMIGSGRVMAYDFRTNIVPGVSEKERGYWKDVGTIDSYYKANMDLVAVSPVFSLYNNLWPIHSHHHHFPPAKFVFSDFGSKRVGVATDSMVCDGAIVSGGSVVRSIISPMVRINSYSTLEESVAMEGVDVGRHCRIRKAIIDKGVRVPPGTEIGFDPEEDRKMFHMSEGGVVVIPKGYEFKA
jgi:glucose-1-phosphate adenylyltransferase